MFKVLDNHTSSVVEQLNELEEDNDLQVLSAEFVGDRHLKVLIKYAPHTVMLTVDTKPTFAGKDTEPTKKAPPVKKAPVVKKS